MDTLHEIEPIEIDLSHIVTEDDRPVDNWFSEKQQRLLVKALYMSWIRTRPFVAGSDIGVFSSPYESPVVPDVLVSSDVEIADDWYAKKHRSYFIWEFGKPPDIAVEVVSNKKGKEINGKMQKYARMRVLYYVVFDPQTLIQNEPVAVYELVGETYRKRDDYQLSWFDLGLALWEGSYEGKYSTYLRWTDSEGDLLLNEEEIAEKAKARADEQEARADQEKVRADQAEAVNKALRKKLRELGIDPDEL